MSPAFAPLTRAERLLFVAIMLAAILVRANAVRRVPLWSDEAESSINALSIQDHGVPCDAYLGMPLFENILIRTWPESPEYEFRDISYSDRGLEIYHGWLPLYSISAALRLAGIHPDHPGTKPPSRTEAEILRRTYIPRIPSVIFGMISLAALFAAARRLAGIEAAWAVLLMAGFHQSHVFLTTSARYYSATLATHAVCGWLMVAVFQDGRTRYFVALGLALVALFHSHLLTFAVGCAAFALLAPWLMRRPGFIKNIALLGIIVAGGTLPWLIATGFLGHSTHIPSAWSLLSLPADLLVYPRTQPVFTALYLAGLAAVLCSVVSRKGRSTLQNTFGQKVGVLSWLYCWMLIAYFTFFLFMPAASFFYNRISVPVLVPALLLASVVLVASLRAVVPAAPPLTIIPVTALLLFAANAVLKPILPPGPRQFRAIDDLVARIQREADADTRFYGSPNDHLVLTYYSGVPVQSIAPVRKEFLDSYPGRIILFEKDALSDEPQPWGDNPVFRGFVLREQADWWKVFFYRFVDPIDRGGKHLNYKDRPQAFASAVAPGWTERIFPPLKTAFAHSRNSQARDQYSP